MPKPNFILNDENVMNSYGFYILTSGGRLERFRDNPVMLSNHINTNENVIGKWENVLIENGQIKATPNFDIDAPLGLDISGKVDRGYLKGASMGIIPKWDSMERIGDKLMLTEWELAEGSIVPVPSNRNSIAIYSADGKLLQEEEVKNLCLSVAQKLPTPENLNLNITMKKILLSVSALLALGLDNQPEDGTETSVVEAKILTLSSENKTLKKDKEALELAAQAMKDAQVAAQKQTVTETVDLAITQGKIPADAKEKFVQLGLHDSALLKSTLEAIPGKKNLGAGVKTPDGNGDTAVATMEDFQKLGLEAQLSFKNDSPEAYKKLFS
jgi:hypothetical protein